MTRGCILVYSLLTWANWLLILGVRQFPGPEVGVSGNTATHVFSFITTKNNAESWGESIGRESMFTDNSKKVLEEIGTIACLSSYLHKINKIHQSQTNKTLYYRGHYHNDFVLKSSVGRLEKYTEELEKELFAKFSTQYYSYTNLRYDKDIDKLFLAQHYGLPTRLLDWTLNPLVALFFACYDDKDLTSKNGEVLVKYVDRQTPIEEKRDVDPFGKDDFSSMLIIPDYFDQRLRNQSAAFTIQQNPNEIEAKSGYRIIVSGKQRILKELAEIGIKVDYIYPTLDRMCERIKKESNY